MNNTSHASAAASVGAATAVVTILVWGASLAGVQVPTEVAGALGVLLSPLVHFVGVRIGAQEAS